MRVKMLVSRVAVGVVLMGAVSAARAQTTWYVDDDNCPGPGSGTPGDPFCRVQDAIAAAVDSDEIVVAPGAYGEALDLLGKAVHLLSSDGPAVTTLDATGLGASVVRCVSGEGPQTILEGFTITGGTGTCCYEIGGTDYLVGGGVRCVYTDGDGVVGVVDFLYILADWGGCEESCCLSDLDLDGDVGVTDFLLVLANWTV